MDSSFSSATSLANTALISVPASAEGPGAAAAAAFSGQSLSYACGEAEKLAIIYKGEPIDNNV